MRPYWPHKHTVIRKGSYVTKKNILFFTLLILFIITSIITLLGITNVIPIEEEAFIKSTISLQFFGDHRIPQETSSENVVSWFAYFSSSLLVQPKDENGNNVAGGLEIPPNWVIVLVFDKPAIYRQAVTNFSNSEACPLIDIHSTNGRMIALSTRGQMPAGIFTIDIIE
jgi:hypothetical protein